MKRYTEIFWWVSHHKKQLYPWIDTAFAEPKHFYPLLREVRAEANYLQCPALSGRFKNSFVIAAAYDLTIAYNQYNWSLNTDRYGQEFYDDFIILRTSDNPDLPILFSVAINYLFFAHEDVEMEVSEVPLLCSKSTANVRLIPAGFNISKWLRPLEYAVEIIDKTKPVEIKAGEPLFMVTFRTVNNVPVKLTRKIETPEMTLAFQAFTHLKKIRPNLKLTEGYDLAANFIDTIKRWLVK